MAYDLAMDVSTSDLIFRDGDLMIIDNAERVAQQVLITLRFWYGEWFLDTTQGVPYLERILVKNPNMTHARQTIRSAIMSVEGVRDILSFDMDFSRVDRSLSVRYSIDTDYGLITRTEILGYGS